MELEPVKIEELTSIIDIYKNAIKTMLNNNIFQWDEFYPDKEILENDINKKQLYKITLNNDIISTFAINKEYDMDYLDGKWEYNGNDFVILHRLCVNPKYQNKGFGTKTILRIEEYLKDNGIKSIRLDTFSKNPIALRLYGKLGYKKTGEANWRKGLFFLFEKIL